MDEMLRLEKISKTFPGVQALKEVDFDLKKGEVHALVGQNGAGKSTLVKIMSGVYKPDKGDFYFEGKKVKIEDVNNARALGISSVHQDLIVFQDLSVLENLFIEELSISLIKPVNWRALRKKAAKIMNEVDIHLPIDEEAGTLSAPMQKLLQILRALLKQPKVLILDEPTAALTHDETEVLFENVKKLQKRGVSVIYISHLLEEIFELADRVTVLRDGKKVMTDQISNLELGDVVRAMIGERLSSFYPKREPKIKGKVLEVKELESGILKNINFILKKGEILGVAGIIGSGRTTLAKTLFGLLQSRKGKIFMDDREVKLKTPRDAIKCGIAFTPENRQREGLILQQSVAFNISLPNLDLMKKKRILLDKEKELSCAKRSITEFDIIPPFPDFQTLHLSGGNQQKVVISKWTLRNSKIIIMDEPTQGIDIGVKRQIYNFMNKYVEKGESIIFISSDFNELVNMCDRVIVLRKGEMVGELKKPISMDKLIALSTKGKDTLSYQSVTFRQGDESK